MTRGRDRRIRVLLELFGDAANQRRLEQGLVALHIDDNGVVGEPERRRGFGEPIGPRRMVAPGEHGLDAMRSRCSADALIVGRDRDTLRAARLRPLGDADHERLAGDVGERLPRQPRRRVARGNENSEAQREPAIATDHSYSAGSSLRASSSSMTGIPSRIG